MPAEKININEEIKLEDAMKRLDGVVRALDAEGLELEESLRLYEEGVALVRVCHEKLSEAERRVKVIRMSADGEMVETELDPSEGK
ncbi:MAG: exodeoxyribonuclease VII small subunit [Clostridia bacterium]|nr:exodeoxyribonuclease VII small subunit [Clostridia bacterium]